MAVGSVDNSLASGSTLGGVSKKDELGQDAFMKLMITQLRNQDPLKPMDPSEFLGQLAQFGTVSGIQNMQDSLAGLSDALRSSQVLNGTSLVGHNVLVATDSATLGAEGDIVGTVTIPANATDAALLVTDSSGQLVRRLPLSTQEGEIAFSWDGLDDRGQRADAGNYKFSTVATVGGATGQIETRLAGYVGSVTIDPASQNLTLNTDLGAFALSKVRSVM
ncbi:MAG: flagellar hook assembly protein FlgD [Steroidobacteraceae bacterium]